MRWFQLDTATPNDPRIRAVLARFGNAGFGALVRLWCFVAAHGKTPGQSIDRNRKPIPKAALVEATGLAESEFDELLSELARSGHIAELKWRKRHIVELPAMRRRADTYSRRMFEQSSKFVRVQDNTKQDISTKEKNRALTRPSFPQPKPKAALVRKVVYQALRDLPSDRSFTDLKEAAKAACAKYHIPYDARVIGAAVESALAVKGKR